MQYKKKFAIFYSFIQPYVQFLAPHPGHHWLITTTSTIIRKYILLPWPRLYFHKFVYFSMASVKVRHFFVASVGGLKWFDSKKKTMFPIRIIFKEKGIHIRTKNMNFTARNAIFLGKIYFSLLRNLPCGIFIGVG